MSHLSVANDFNFRCKQSVGH